MTTIPTIAAIRFGYGLSPLHDPPADAEAVLIQLAEPDQAMVDFPIQTYAEAQPVGIALDKALAVRRQDRLSKTADAEISRLNKQLRARYGLGFQANVARAAYSPLGFRERLTAFWADHFTVRAKVVRDIAGPSAFADEAIRPHIAGRFGDMLVAVVTHPMMLTFLDQSRSFGPNSTFATKRNRGLNENLAREILELHTLGVGGSYAQIDVRGFAELLTGLYYEPVKGFQFRPGMAEPGAETVLGKSYGDEARPKLADIIAALQDIAVHPDTARHLAHKLATHFTADQPDEQLVEHISAAYSSSSGNLAVVYAALLEHPATWASFGAKAKQPYDFLVSSVRALGVAQARFLALGPEDIRDNFLVPLQLMGQPYQEPNGPDGWAEEAEAWITPQGLAGRIQWAMTTPELLTDQIPDPRSFVTTALGDAAGPQLLLAAERAESLTQGVGIILASPEFNRR